MFFRLREDIKTVFEKDPAAKNIIEVLLCYPGLHSIFLHRIAHLLYKKKFNTLARLISHISRHLTGIEIHPGAKIGRRFFIDHGMGVVIGETAEIGDDVLIYQGVVLGGTTLKKEKRHPTIGNKVIIGTGAIILGPVLIGDNSRIGAGSVVISDIPANATAVGIPARVGLGFTQEEIEKLEHARLPDPIADAIKFVLGEQDKLVERLKILEERQGIISSLEEHLKDEREKIEKTFKNIHQHNEGSGI